MMIKITTEVTRTKETRHKVVYGNDEPNTPVPVLYIERRVLPIPPPEKIAVTIEESEL